MVAAIISDFEKPLLFLIAQQNFTKFDVQTLILHTFLVSEM